MSNADKNIKTGMENARTSDPLERNDTNPSENSRLHAATAIQSSTTPEAYPEFEREAQVEQATGRPAPGKSKPG